MDVGDELDGLAVLAKLFRLDILEDLHAVVPSQSCVEGVRREAASPKTSLTVLLKPVLGRLTLVVGLFAIDQGPIKLLLPV